MTAPAKHVEPGVSAELVDEITWTIVRIEANWDRETSGPGSRFEGEMREHAAARGVLNDLARRGLLR